MAIKFNFSPAGLAAILASRAGFNEAEREAITRAQQQQQSDREYQLQQQQQAMQADRDSNDGYLRAMDVKGRLANIYSDNQRQDKQFAYNQQKDAATNQLQRDELTQRQKFQDEGNAIRRDDLTRKDAADQAAEQSRRDQLAAKVSTAQANLQARVTYHDAEIAQRDRESQARTQALVLRAQQKNLPLDKAEVTRHGEEIDSAAAYYKLAKDAAARAQKQAGAGMNLDPQADPGLQEATKDLDDAAARVKSAHAAYNAYLDQALSGTATAPTASPATQPAGQGMPASTRPAPGAAEGAALPPGLDRPSAPGAAITPDVAQRFLNAANGDPATARHYAAALGWSF